MAINYALNPDGNSYKIIPTSCEVGMLNIPTGYNNKPITYIDNQAFYNCPTLSGVNISENITGIGDVAFYLTNLTGVVIGTGVRTIGVGAFAGTKMQNISIPDSVSIIKGQAFQGCLNLKEINIGSGLNTLHLNNTNDFLGIASTIFSNCLSLTGINISNNNPNYSSVDGIIFNKNQKFLVFFPNAKRTDTFNVPNSVTGVADNAFNSTNVNNINNIIFDKNVVVNMARAALAGSSAKLISLPTGLFSAKLPDYLCGGCSRLEEINIPNNIENIGEYAFNNCLSLYKIEIPPSVTELGSSVFLYSPNLRHVYFRGNATTSLGNPNGFLCFSIQPGFSPNLNLKLYKYKESNWGSTFNDANYNYPMYNITVGSLKKYAKETETYINAVETADGQALEEHVKDSVNRFIIGCKIDGIWDAIKSCCILAGARTLNGALVPLKGMAPTNFNFISSHYNRATGLKGGSGRYLNSNRKDNDDPQNNQHIAIYMSEFLNSAFQYHIGSNNTSGVGIRSGIIHGPSNSIGLFSRTNPTFTVDASSHPFKGVSRNNSTQFSYYSSPTSFGNTNPNNTSLFSSSPNNLNIFVFNWSNTAGNPDTYYSSARIAFYSIGEGLNLSLLNDRINALMNAFSILT